MVILKGIKKWIDEAEAVVIGAGAGLSAAAGFEYGGNTFLKHFNYMYQQYGYKDMYSAGFHHFSSLEEKWGYWSKMIDLNRYQGVKPLYQTLLQLVKNKNYFVITTNVDHQFQLAGFDKKRLFYMQGDYGLFQCSKGCHNKTYDNEKIVKEMVMSQKNHCIPQALIPKCPICGAPMTTNLRCDDTFIEDEGWHQAQKNYVDFIKQNKNKKILFLELGVGFSTPVWIKYPFIKMTLENPKAKYIVIDQGYNPIIKELDSQQIIIKENIAAIINE